MLLFSPELTLAASSATPTPSAVDRLDLLAMVIRPSDLDALRIVGFGAGPFPNLRLEPRGGSLFDGAAAEEAMTDGYIQSVHSAMQATSAERGLEYYLTDLVQFATPEGAMAWLAAFSARQLAFTGDPAGSVNVSTLPAATVGDASTLLLQTPGANPDGFKEGRLLFRSGGVVGMISFISHLPPSDDALASNLTGLGGSVAKRVAAGNQATPNLGNNALLVNGLGDVTVDLAQALYLRIGGVTMPNYHEAKRDFNERDAAYSDAELLDVFYMTQPLSRVGSGPSAGSLIITLKRYESGAAAAAAFAKARSSGGAEAPGSTITSNAKPSLGDESFGFSIAPNQASATLSAKSVYAVRIGATVVVIDLEQKGLAVTPEAIWEIAKAQTDCITSAGSCGPLAMPSGVTIAAS